MYRHYIVLSSSYKSGSRIALDFPLQDGEITDEIMKQVETIQQTCGVDTSLSIHTILTDSRSWQSVIKTDSFFDGVLLVDNLESFIRMINEDRILKGLDIARYILSCIKCTHLKLEKLVYLCYADYICKTGKKLFEDDIFAFRYGPVISSVYEYYKAYGDKYIEENSSDLLPATKSTYMSARSRILFSESGREKVRYVDDTIKYYGDMSAGQLVELTHLPGTPWTETYDGGRYKKISDECIKQFHKNEQ